VRIVILAAVVASTVYAGAPRLMETAQLALTMPRFRDVDARRAILFGSWYRAVRQIDGVAPRDASIDFVLLRPEARDIAVLGAAELQPRDVRLFDGWDGWKQRKRTILIHGERAANAVVGPPPLPAPFVVAVDPNAEPPLKLTEPPR
jgi:hypothetical protein